jgi:hypothetical protein
MSSRFSGLEQLLSIIIGRRATSMLRRVLPEKGMQKYC